MLKLAKLHQVKMPKKKSVLLSLRHVKIDWIIFLPSRMLKVVLAINREKMKSEKSSYC